MAKVLVTDHPFPDLEPERSVLEPLGVELIRAPDTDEDALADAARGAAALLVCYAEITEKVISAAQPTCRVIARYGVGFDNIDVDAASMAGVLVTYVPDYCLDEVADHTMSLLLAAARAVALASREVERGRWGLPEAPVHRLRGQRLALVGVGRIGQRVAERARSFGFEVVGFDPFLQDWDTIDAERADTLEEALVDADAISLHVPLTPENRHLISDQELSGLKRRPILVNTSRGGLVDLEAVVRALEDGRLSAVALDVTEPEPLPPDHPLRGHPRAIVTPHMAYYSVEAQQDLQARAAEEVARALRGEPPRSPVNPDVLAAPSR